MENRLIAINFVDKSVNTIDHGQGFKNIFCTPWIGDLDNDGYLDLVYCQCFHHADLIAFLGLRIKRVDLPVKIKRRVAWGAYMGSDGNGIFQPTSPKSNSPK